MNLYEFEGILVYIDPAVHSEPCLNQKKTKNGISQDGIKSNFKVEKYTTNEHIGRYCLSVASYNEGIQVYFNSNNIVD